MAIKHRKLDPLPRFVAIFLSGSASKWMEKIMEQEKVFLMTLHQLKETNIYWLISQIFLILLLQIKVYSACVDHWVNGIASWSVLPIPSSDKGGGLKSRASSLSFVKSNIDYTPNNILKTGRI